MPFVHLAVLVGTVVASGSELVLLQKHAGQKFAGEGSVDQTKVVAEATPDAVDACDFGFTVAPGFGVMGGAGMGSNAGRLPITHVVPDGTGNYIAGLREAPFFKMAKFDESGASVSNSARVVHGGEPATPEEMLANYEGSNPAWTALNGYIFMKGAGFSCPTPAPATATPAPMPEAPPPTPAPAPTSEAPTPAATAGEEEEDEGEMIRDKDEDGKRCRRENRVMDLKDDVASVEGCGKQCRKNPDCMAFSGKPGKWCIGCNKALDEDAPDRDSEAYKKVRCMKRCRNEKRVGPFAERCNTPECNGCPECPDAKRP